MKIRIAIIAFVLSMLLNLALADWALDWRIVPALLGGWFLADLASGVIHMLMDYIPCPEGVGLGKLYFYGEGRDTPEYAALRRAVFARISPLDRILFDFKVHHPRPDSLGRRSLHYQIWSTIVFGALPVSLLLNAWALLWPAPGWAMAAALVFVIGGTFSQYFHGSLHRAENPPIVHVLRRLGLLMTPEMHDRHHQSLQRDFATISGWSNPLLNPLFRWLRAHGHLRDEGLEPVG